jgi:O-antigen/teichoic acid export membrane protein
VSVQTLGELDEAPSQPLVEERPPGLRAESLAEGVVLLLALTVAQRVIGFGRAVLFCRWLDPDQLGLWDMAWGFLTMAAPLAVLSLPGTFGRYCEHFRQRGELRPFVRRTAAFCLTMAMATLAIIVVARNPLSVGIFGDAQYSGLMLASALALATTVVYNYLTGLFTALRSIRVVSLLDFLSSLLFAAIGGGLLAAGYATAESVVLAWGAACLVCSLVAMVWLRRVWQAAPEPPQQLSHRSLWRKLAPFAAWILAINMLTNLFAMIDRALIIHFAPGDSLAVLGQYHSSRVVPMLLVSIAALLATMLLPHLSHDWEAGLRGRVSHRLGLFLKLSTFGMTAAGAGILLVAPWLFDTAFAGKYADGLAVLPWTLVLCVWFGVAMIAQQYLWCAERARYVCIALGVGLTVSVALSVVLLPRYGLWGAVMATTAANAVALLMIVELSRRLGFVVDRGLVVVLAAPMALALGWPAACAVLVLLALAAWRNMGLLNDQERDEIVVAAEGYVHRLGKLVGSVRHEVDR